MKGGFEPLTKQKGDPLLAVRDVVDWPQFCLRLNRDGAETLPNPGKRIWLLLPPVVQKEVQGSAQSGIVESATEADVTAALNAIMTRQDFHQSDAFAIVVLPDEAKGLLAQGPRQLDKGEVRRLNRLLLEASFPLVIAKSQGHLQKIFARFAAVPILGFLVGALVTAVVQSSSATIGIIQILAATGVLTLGAALPLVLGTHVGTCMTAYIASFGTNVNARRAARAHLLYNLFGGLYLFVLGLLSWFVQAIVPGELSAANIAVHIAVAHTTTNVLSTLIFIPFVGTLETWVTRWVPSDGSESMGEPQFLEKHLIETPVLALDSARKEILRMMQIASEAVDDAMAGLMGGKAKAIRRVRHREEAIDRLQGEITDYLVEIVSQEVDLAEASEFPTLIHVVNDIERIGDHAVNIAELAETYREDKLSFSKAALRDLRRVRDEVQSMMAETIQALRDNDLEVAKQALRREETINGLEVDGRKSHAARLAKKKCSVADGIVFLDVLTNLEKIGDHLANIDQAVLGAFHWGEKYRLVDEDEPIDVDAVGGDEGGEI